MKTPIPGAGQWNNRAALTTVKISTPDSDDNQIWLQSSIAATHRLQRRESETFSFTADSLQLITNCGGDIATVLLDCTACAESGLFVGSNRRGGVMMTAGQRLTVKMRAGEVLSLRSLDACEPHSRDDGGRVRLRPGQSVVVA
jgi:hypothetical protein